MACNGAPPDNDEPLAGSESVAEEHPFLSPFEGLPADTFESPTDMVAIQRFHHEILDKIMPRLGLAIDILVHGAWFKTGDEQLLRNLPRIHYNFCKILTDYHRHVHGPVFRECLMDYFGVLQTETRLFGNMLPVLETWTCQQDIHRASMPQVVYMHRLCVNVVQLPLRDTLSCRLARLIGAPMLDASGLPS